MRKTILLLITVLFAGLASVNAQRTQVHLGLSLPQGKFADESDSKLEFWKYGRGGAATGFNIGLKYYQDLSVDNLSLVFGVDAFYNALQSDLVEDIEDYYGDDFEVTKRGKHINIPVTGGINYTYPLSESFSIYGEGFLGLNTYLFTKSEMEYKDNTYSETYKPGFGLAYGVEGGLIFGKGKYSVGLRYNNLGSYKLKYDYENDGVFKNVAEDGDDKFSKKLPISILSVTFGFFF